MNEKSRRDEKKRKVYNYNQQQLIENRKGKGRTICEIVIFEPINRLISSKSSKENAPRHDILTRFFMARTFPVRSIKLRFKKRYGKRSSRCRRIFVHFFFFIPYECTLSSKKENSPGGNVPLL